MVADDGNGVMGLFRSQRQADAAVQGLYRIGLTDADVEVGVPEPGRYRVEYYESQDVGRGILRGMALGIPVASTTAGGLPEMLDRGAGLLAPPNDPQALAEAVMQLLTQPTQAARVRAQATAAVAQFSARQMAEGVRSVYRSCVSFP